MLSNQRKTTSAEVDAAVNKWFDISERVRKNKYRNVMIFVAGLMICRQTGFFCNCCVTLATAMVEILNKKKTFVHNIECKQTCHPAHT